MSSPNRDKGSKQHVLDLVSSPSFEATMNRVFQGTGIRIFNPNGRCPSGRSCAAEWAETEVERFADKLHIPGYQKAILSRWWIVHRGRKPNWDLLCQIVVDGKLGLLLVEAKAHEGEMLENDRKTLEHNASEDAKANHEQIKQRVAEANASLNRLNVGQFRLSIVSHYQLANRFAYLDKLARTGVPTVLLYLGWLRSSAWPKDRFRDQVHWLAVMKQYMRGIVPSQFPEQRFRFENGGSMQMLIRSLPTQRL